jgi:hypothetical protein
MRRRKIPSQLRTDGRRERAARRICEGSPLTLTEARAEIAARLDEWRKSGAREFYLVDDHAVLS